MICVIAILWLLALCYTIRKRSRQIRIIKTKIKERYEQKSQKGKGEET
jgi:Na+/alanine symporter